MNAPAPHIALRRFYLAIGIGAGIGSLLRYLVALAAAGMALSPLYGTSTVNIVGSFIIGLFATLTEADGRIAMSTLRRQFVMTGFCGGLTTFSSMTLETLLTFRAAGFWPALGYLGGLIAASLLAGYLGIALARKLNR